MNGRYTIFELEKILERIQPPHLKGKDPSVKTEYARPLVH